MLNKQSVTRTLTIPATRGGSVVPFWIGHVLAIASLWIDRVHPADDGCFEPDALASETPFLRDHWPFN